MVTRHRTCGCCQGSAGASGAVGIVSRSAASVGAGGAGGPAAGGAGTGAGEPSGARWQLPVPCRCSARGSAVRSLHSAVPSKSVLPPLPVERHGEAKQCLFLAGHEEDLAAPEALEGTGEGPVLQDQQWW